MQTCLNTLLLYTITILGSAACLRGTYRLIETKWPTAYVQVRTYIGQLGRFSLVYNILFRLLPPFVVLSATSTTATRLSLNNTAICIASGILFLYKPLQVTIRDRKSKMLHEWNLLVQSLNILLYTMGGIVGYFTSPLFQILIPKPNEIWVSTWTAAFAGAAAYSLHRGRPRDEADTETILRARKDIGGDNWTYIKTACSSRRISPDPVRALLLAEAIQRPRWFRNLERWAAGIGMNIETTGLSQMPSISTPSHSNRRSCKGFAHKCRRYSPLSDHESIDRLCDDITAWQINTSKTIQSELKAYAKHHNDDDVYVKYVETCHKMIADGKLPDS